MFKKRKTPSKDYFPFNAENHTIDIPEYSDHETLASIPYSALMLNNPVSTPEGIKHMFNSRVTYMIRKDVANKYLKADKTTLPLEIAEQVDYMNGDMYQLITFTISHDEPFAMPAVFAYVNKKLLEYIIRSTQQKISKKELKELLTYSLPLIKENK